MKRTLTVVAFALAAVPAHAQEFLLLPSSPSDVHQAQAPSTAPPAPTAAAVMQMPPEKLQRIYHIRQLEGVMTNAVKAGASTLAYQLGVAEPSLFLTTTARTRGFELEGYGVFFDVDVPAMLQSAVWNVQFRQEQYQYYDSLRATVADPKIRPEVRRVAEMEMRRVERLLGLPSSQQAQAALGAGPQQAAQNMVVAQNAETTLADARTVPAPAAPPADVRDPNERYTDAIKDKLIDAMLNYGTALRLDDEEWLVIAARATSDILPGQLDDAASILLRIKGADLNAYVLKKISRDEVIKKIEIKVS